ncbi:MAG TPA: GTP cyclohydrolase II, partial [Sphingomicrobium sp.]|nr:GTP cyclohydrolase II [Sphingomicrobium sp.]
DPEGAAPLLISGERAAALGLGNRREAGDLKHAVQLHRSDWLDRAAVRYLADPGEDFSRGPLGPLEPLPLDCPAEAEAILTLARLAGVVPAVWLLPRGEAQAAIAVEDIMRAMREPQVELVARARLPLEELEQAQIVAFRDRATGEDHVALLIGAFAGEPPLVRLHSECLTGDVFGSLKCDCGPQLREALRLIGAAGGGVLLYLRQEGRGIGLPNKLRAYALQDRGLDTVEANRRLGFADDERGYGVAAAMLKALGVERVRLLTNNPAKVAGLQAAGIGIAERVAHHMPVNPHNADYVAVKRAKSGHLD